MVKNLFSKKTICIVGLGGVGSNIANRLARNECNLRIIDRDRIYQADLTRQDLYGHQEINKFKAKEAKKKLDLINPEVTVKAFHEDLQDDNSFLLQGNIIIDASNDPKTNLVIMKKAAQDKMDVFQVNYAGNEGIIKYYQGKTKELKFTKTIAKAGCTIELTELLTGILLNQMILLLSKKPVKPEIKIDTNKLNL